MFAEHLAETEGQERRVREQLERCGARPSTVKERAMADRLAGLWQRAVDASLRETGAEDVRRASRPE